VPANGGFPITDGRTFSIKNGAAPAVVFEFDRNGIWNPQNVRIQFTANDSQDQLSNKVLTAIQGVASLGLLPSYLGGGVIHLGSRSVHMVTVPANLTSVGGRHQHVQHHEWRQPAGRVRVRRHHGR
jgi:hypothetical protein